MMYLVRTFLLVVIEVVIGATVFFNVALADQWYDTLPPTGEYLPLPDAGYGAAPQDFQSLNATGADEENNIVESTSSTDIAVEPDEQPSAQKGVNYILVIALVVVVVAAVTARWWVKWLLQRTHV